MGPSNATRTAGRPGGSRRRVAGSRGGRALGLVLGLALGAAGASLEAGALEDAAAVLADPRAPVASRVAACAAVADASAEMPRHDRALAALSPALSDRSADVRAAAARALVRVGDQRAVGALADRSVLESDDTVLSTLLLGIGRLGSPSDVARVAALRSHASPRARAAVATTLGDLGGPAAREALLAMLADPGPDEAWAVRGSVLLALARCGKPEDAGTILVAYREGGGAQQWFGRAALATVVAALDPDPVPTLDRLVADSDPRVSTAAAVALVRAGHEAEVVARLADPRPGVRAAAAVALAQTERRAHVARIRTLVAEDPDRAVRWSAALALSRLDDPAADTYLVEGLSSDDPEVWSTALAECRRKTGLTIGRDPDAWRRALAARRRGEVR